MRSTFITVGLLVSVVFISSSSRLLGSAEPNSKTTLQHARADVRGHRLADAVAAYEKVVADSSKDAARYKADALYELLLLRLSNEPAVRDLPRGTALVESLRAYPAYPRAQEIAAFAGLFREAEQRAADEKQLGEKRVVEANAKLEAAVARADDLGAQLTTAKQLDESGKLRQEAVGLRADNRNLRGENKTLRDQLGKAYADLQKKDEALKRVAGSVLKSR